MTRLERLEAVAEAARRYRETRRIEDDPDGLAVTVARSMLYAALAALDGHTEAPQETVTLAVWSVNAGQSVRFAVAGAEDDRPDAAWENRLGTFTLPLNREGGR